MPKQVELEQVDHVMQVRNLGNINKQTISAYAGRAGLQPGQSMLAHNVSCTVLRRIARHTDGSLEVGMLTSDALKSTVSSLLDMANTAGPDTRRGRKYLGLAQKFIKKNKRVFS